MYKVGITGHRHWHDPDQAKQRLFIFLDRQVKEGSTLVTGGALGTDQWAAQWAMVNKKSLGRDIEYEVIAPFPVAIQGVKWTLGQRADLEELIKHAAFTMVIQEHYSVEGFNKRDQIMVDRSQEVIAFMRPKTRRGGTLHTVNYTKSVGKPITLYDLDTGRAWT